MPPRQQTGGRTKATLFLVGAFFVAIVVAVVVLQIVKKYQQDFEARNAPQKTVTVVVAIKDLYRGIPIGPEDVSVTEVVPQVIPQGQQGQALVFQSAEEVLGRTPREKILTNEIVRSERLARRDAGVGLNAIITPGKRAMTIETDIASGLAGFLQPNNFVDVIVTLRPDDVTGRTSFQTETILQGVKVLAVGSSMGPEETTGTAQKKADNQRRAARSSATLELTLEEAEKLALAASRGDLHLVLRSDVDITQVVTNGPISASTIIGWQKDTAKVVQTSAPVSRPARPSGDKPTTEPTSTTVIISGSDENTVQYDEKGNKITPSKNR